MRPKVLYYTLSCSFFTWRCVPKFYTVLSVPLSPLEPFLCNTGLKMRPKFNAVSSQLDLSCTMLDWRSVLMFYTVLSVPLSSLEDAMFYTVLSVSHLNLSCATLGWRCVQSLMLCLLSWTFLVQCLIEDVSQLVSSNEVSFLRQFVNPLLSSSPLSTSLL